MSIVPTLQRLMSRIMRRSDIALIYSTATTLHKNAVHDLGLLPKSKLFVIKEPHEGGLGLVCSYSGPIACRAFCGSYVKEVNGIELAIATLRTQRGARTQGASITCCVAFL